jgi:outer membrane protein OmpA-like peptidoglycan-associated protein
VEKKEFFVLGLFILFNCKVSSQTQDTTILYFAFDKSEVMQTANIQKLDSLCNEISKNIPSSIDILGYADIKGSKVYNLKLSSERANNVREYLIKKGIQEKIIGLCEGKGAISSFTKNYITNDPAKCRRVDVICKRTISTPTIKIEKPHSSDSLHEIVNLNIGERFILKNMNFNPGSDILLNESLPTLRKLLTILLENTSLKIRIEGHICCDNGNADVSTKRAKKIYDYLVQNGVSSVRLSYIGLGNNYPLVSPEVTEDDRIKNRRVEILIVDK